MLGRVRLFITDGHPLIAAGESFMRGQPIGTAAFITRSANMCACGIGARASSSRIARSGAEFRSAIER